ncbi:DUF4231 domain-containing protein [Streptomyces sp. NPDC101112]|uniref:DUF4231 domain-containing protein n=1 Tax=Streptomyces sp. NPDC101112 TaxID=3366105 RepID=UPI0038204616
MIMASGMTLIEVEQKIIEQEALVDHTLFLRRLARIWLFAVMPLMITAIVAGNILIDFSKPGNGREALNVLLAIPLLISLVGAPPSWWFSRINLQDAQTQLRQHKALREAMQPKGSEVAQQTSEAFQRYRDAIPALLGDYRQAADKYRTRHNLFQITVIVGSILTSVATTAAAEEGLWSWIAVGLSAAVSISAGIISYFKFRERSMNLQQTADSVDQEMQAFSLRIRRYRDLSPDQAASAFAEEIERIKEEQRKKELQLEQPPEVHQHEAAGQGAMVQP